MILTLLVVKMGDGMQQTLLPGECRDYQTIGFILAHFEYHCLILHTIGEKLGKIATCLQVLSQNKHLGWKSADTSPLNDFRISINPINLQKLLQ